MGIILIIFSGIAYAYPAFPTSVSTPVGGTFEGVNTVSLLVTGAQMNAAWMIPVLVSAIGIGIVIARKF